MSEPASAGPAPVEALVVIDMQKGFLAGDAAVAGADRLIANVSDLLLRARQAQALVIHLQNDGSAGAVDEPGRPGWELCLTGVDEAVVRKTSDDGFAHTPLGALLERRRVRRIAIGGLLSEMCVSATARTALARGFSVVLPRDAHSTYPLDDIPAHVVARVAEHSLGDEVELVGTSAAVDFVAPPA
ncbi:isochorismatase family protein [Actinoallomurus rhizosphaericola]|uniref:isochorismatase family protein n=1 Tax=Actinoallomurus rhizosphaericola TaxID=2952536 RepID=UPI00209341A8|nr:isochorismatase family protein [Actinoallomurus rhizosphaericola]MCO5994861.1 isochorismatase family protein [Actinoallomurus rhizosphaericola]